jgi:hypothetical protein
MCLTRADLESLKSMEMTTIDLSIMAPPRQLALIFPHPELRPPVYDEMVQDMGNLINKVVAPFVDPSCVELHFEELVSKCWLKTTEMNHKGLLDRSRTRSEYFAQYKTAISNHIYSEVQRHVFTEKRTGVKPPPKDKRHLSTEPSARRMEVRIDDPDTNLQLSEIESGDDSAAFREIVEEVSIRLKSVEKLVLDQLLSPNEDALTEAWLDANRGCSADEPLRIRIRHEHLAKGIGLTNEEFHRHHESIRQKCLFMKTQHEDDPRFTAAMSTLIQFFGLQIPRSIDEMTRKRALMIAGQHQYDRVKENQGIQEAMKICGIPVPEPRSENDERLRCFGVMYQKHHRICENCGLKEACEVKAANFGLGEITMSHRLLGQRHNRVPVIRPARMGIDAAIADNERDDEILVFLDENFQRVAHMGEQCYKHKDRVEGDGMQLIFSIGKQIAPLRLRFINPCEELQSGLKLESSKKGGRAAWVLPEDASTTEAINLIRAHAADTFAKA